MPHLAPFISFIFFNIIADFAYIPSGICCQESNPRLFGCKSFPLTTILPKAELCFKRKEAGVSNLEGPQIKCWLHFWINTNMWVLFNLLYLVVLNLKKIFAATEIKSLSNSSNIKQTHIWLSVISIIYRHKNLQRERLNMFFYNTLTDIEKLTKTYCPSSKRANENEIAIFESHIKDYFSIFWK